ncbi:uncharacterized protein SO_4814 [Shewanella oneidensis MR-1]|uniref:Uncharacterized protein n=1 Tax=Shewanella oneidensis (strain ATCC 700550 / JCM 31522 / CIP 106686 / LMG 19005 / NCIMB 14063 / MR-1) TaxID=211586 RepID=K4PSK8_SHEON|nr:uncharacterized protein SO_4814 [Shewanella oneidensis MR-1]
MVSLFEQNGTGFPRLSRPVLLWRQPCSAFHFYPESRPPLLSPTPENPLFALRLTFTKALRKLSNKLLVNNKKVAKHLTFKHTAIHKTLVPTLSIQRNTRHESC